jgi:hypothetical protein
MGGCQSTYIADSGIWLDNLSQASAQSKPNAITLLFGSGLQNLFL